MKFDIAFNQGLMRKIFGVCPCCQELFRLSDLEIHQKERTKAEKPDWMDRLQSFQDSVARLEERLETREAQARETAREAGRKAGALAMKKAIRKVDYVFAPAKLDPRDSKVMFHPIDFIIFDGLLNRDVQKVVLLDRKAQSQAQKDLQRNVESVIKRKAFEWKTIHVTDDGEVKAT
jgi:predicted Holliday junction resolvase-like endonuclease